MLNTAYPRGAGSCYCPCPIWSFKEKKEASMATVNIPQQTLMSLFFLPSAAFCAFYTVWGYVDTPGQRAHEGVINPTLTPTLRQAPRGHSVWEPTPMRRCDRAGPCLSPGACSHFPGLLLRQSPGSLATRTHGGMTWTQTSPKD